MELDGGRRAVLPRSYIEESASLGYALTVFRSQGITVDHTFGLGGDTLSQEAGYTQLSRGRLTNNLYLAAPETMSRAWAELPDRGTPDVDFSSPTGHNRLVMRRFA